MKLRLTHHNDPQHGWIETPYALVATLGFREKISEYSYYDQSKQVFYLEEDYDALLLVKALEACGVQYEIEDRYYPNMKFQNRLARLKRVGT